MAKPATQFLHVVLVTSIELVPVGTFVLHVFSPRVFATTTTRLTTAPQNIEQDKPLAAQTWPEPPENKKLFKMIKQWILDTFGTELNDKVWEGIPFSELLTNDGIGDQILAALRKEKLKRKAYSYIQELVALLQKDKQASPAKISWAIGRKPWESLCDARGQCLLLKSMDWKDFPVCPQGAPISSKGCVQFFGNHHQRIGQMVKKRRKNFWVLTQSWKQSWGITWLTRRTNRKFLQKPWNDWPAHFCQVWVEKACQEERLDLTAPSLFAGCCLHIVLAWGSWWNWMSSCQICHE